MFSEKLAALQKESEKIEGFLSQNGHSLHEGEVLYHLARKTPARGIIVEIGSWKGKSTIWMGKGSESGPKSTIYAIDPHTGSPEQIQPIWTFPEFEKNVAQAGLTSLIQPILKTSSEAARTFDQPIDLLFIDGAHGESFVRKDAELWLPKVKIGGTVAFHDSFIGWPGVRKVAHEYLFLSSSFKQVRYINSISYGIKLNPSLTERLQNKLSILIKITHEASLSFPQPLKSLIKRSIWKPHQKKWLRELYS